MRMAVAFTCLVAVGALGFQPAANTPNTQKPQKQEPTPTLNSLQQASKALVIKRAKNVYRMPDGRLVDLDVAATIVEQYSKALEMHTDYHEERGNSNVTTRVAGQTYPIVNPFPAQGLSAVAPLVRIWKDKKELPAPAKGWGAAAAGMGLPKIRARGGVGADELNWLFRWPIDKLNGNESWRVVSTSTPDIMRLDVTVPEEPPSRGTASSFASYYIRANETLKFHGNEITVAPSKVPTQEFFIVPVPKSQDAAAGAGTSTTAETAVVNGSQVPICDLVAASSLRLTPEGLAKALLDGELQLVEWKKNGTAWEATQVPIKTKAP